MTPQQACSAESSTLLTTPIRGYRTWRLNAAGQLRSTAFEHVWATPDVTAVCAAERKEQPHPGCPCPQCATHEAPSADCVCGIYGWYDPEDERHVKAPVFGVIEVSGEVLLGDHGFRAGRARLLAVCVPEGTAKPPAWRDLERQGVRVFEDRAALLAEYPRDDLSGLVEHECDDECVRDPWLASMQQFMSSISYSSYSPSFATGGLVPSARTFQLGEPAEADTPPERPPLWKRWAALIGAVLVAAVTANGAVSLAFRAVSESHWWALAAAFCGYGTWNGCRLVLRARRWGWQR